MAEFWFIWSDKLGLPEYPTVYITLSRIMTSRSSIKYANTSGEAQILIIEPWATEFLLPPGSECEVFAIGGADLPIVQMEVSDESIVFWVNTAGALYEYWQDGVLID